MKIPLTGPSRSLTRVSMSWLPSWWSRPTPSQARRSSSWVRLNSLLKVRYSFLKRLDSPWEAAVSLSWANYVSKLKGKMNSWKSWFVQSELDSSPCLGGRGFGLLDGLSHLPWVHPGVGHPLDHVILHTETIILCAVILKLWKSLHPSVGESAQKWEVTWVWAIAFNPPCFFSLPMSTPFGTIREKAIWAWNPLFCLW